MAREREQVNAVGWEKDEDRFLLSQLKMLSLKRVIDLRPQAIDLLFLIYSVYYKIYLKQNILEREITKTSVEQQLEQMESNLILPLNLPSPVKIIKQIESKEDLESLSKDVELFYIVESDSRNFFNQNIKNDGVSISSYWSGIQIIIDDQEQVIDIKNDPKNMNLIQNYISPELLTSIDPLLEGKEIEELRLMEQQVNLVLSSNQTIDEEYWRALLKRLKLHKASSHVLVIYQTVLNDIKSNPNIKTSNFAENITYQKTTIKKEESDDDEEFEDQKHDLNINSFPQDDVYIPPTLDEDSLFKEEELKGLDFDEEAFTEQDVEFADKDKSDLQIKKALSKYAFNDKFKPRKPKYFNRMKTGFEWTKYNQVHYDHDNPPPKVVQGYKFTIFYPDLIDHSKPPQFSIEESDSPDFVVLRFHAGPPYLDIAFRIVNKEWSLGTKFGYKCLFSRGVLYLWFNFKRMRYRR